MDEALKQKLVFLADKYEQHSFIEEDPSQFVYWYPKLQQKDVEAAAFIASMLAFGSRKQFIPKIRQILILADETSGAISKWLEDGAPEFPFGTQKFYRFYSYDDFRILFSEISEILKNASSLGEYFKSRLEKFPEQPLDFLISEAFPLSKIVPKGRNSANKRIQMFLRWMVRTGSCVDVGIWSWYSPEKLIMPIDVHVLQESIKLGLLSENQKATRKTALELTQKMKEVFPDDPCRADFSLFGLGVDNHL